MSGDGLCAQSQTVRVSQAQNRPSREQPRGCKIVRSILFGPQNHKNHSEKKDLTRRQASHFLQLQLVPGLSRVAGPGLPSNQVECVALVFSIYTIIPCVKNRIFRFPMDGRLLTTSTFNSLCAFSRRIQIIESNHACFCWLHWRLQGDCKYSNLTVRQKQSKPIGITPCMSQKGVGSTIEEIAISGCVLGSGWVGSGETDEI